MHQVLKTRFPAAGVVFVLLTMPSSAFAANGIPEGAVDPQDPREAVLSQAQELIRQDEIFFLEQENRKLKEKIAVKDTVIAAVQAEKDSLVLRVVDLEKKSSVANMFLEESALKIKALSSEKAELEAQLLALTGEKDAAAEQAARLNKQLLEMKPSVEKEAVVAADAEAKLAIERIRSGAAKSIEAVRFEAEKARQAILDENAALKEQLAQKSAAMDDKENNFLKLTVEKAVLSDRLSSAETSVKDLRARVAELERQNSQLKDSLIKASQGTARPPSKL